MENKMTETQRRRDGGSVKVTQRQNLMKLRHIRPYSLRELAKRSTELAERRGDLIAGRGAHDAFGRVLDRGAGDHGGEGEAVRHVGANVVGALDREVDREGRSGARHRERVTRSRASSSERETTDAGNPTTQEYSAVSHRARFQISIIPRRIGRVSN